MLQKGWFRKLISSATVVCFVLATCLVFTTGCQQNTKACAETCKQDKSCPKECPKMAGKEGKCPPDCKKACCAAKDKPCHKTGEAPAAEKTAPAKETPTKDKPAPGTGEKK